jgi:hypothetical protein
MLSVKIIFQIGVNAPMAAGSNRADGYSERGISAINFSMYKLIRTLYRSDGDAERVLPAA